MNRIALKCDGCSTNGFDISCQEDLDAMKPGEKSIHPISGDRWFCDDCVALLLTDVDALGESMDEHERERQIERVFKRSLDRERGRLRVVDAIFWLLSILTVTACLWGICMLFCAIVGLFAGPICH